MGHVAEDVKLSQALLAESSGLGQEDRTLLEDNLDCLKERLGALGCALGQRCDHMRSKAHELTAYQVTILLEHFQHNHNFFINPEGVYLYNVLTGSLTFFFKCRPSCNFSKLP